MLCPQPFFFFFFYLSSLALPFPSWYVVILLPTTPTHPVLYNSPLSASYLPAVSSYERSVYLVAGGTDRGEWQRYLCICIIFLFYFFTSQSSCFLILHGVLYERVLCFRNIVLNFSLCILVRMYLVYCCFFNGKRCIIIELDVVQISPGEDLQVYGFSRKSV